MSLACRKVLSPYNAAEAITVEQAASRAGKSEGAIRYWCDKHGIGRRVVGTWSVSRVALEMLLEGDTAALVLYHSGELHCETVAGYFDRLGISIPTIIKISKGSKQHG